MQDRWADLSLDVIALINNYKVENNLLLFGDPRGGSTWVTEMLRSIPRTAVIWEPLHLHGNELFRELGFTWRQYIPHDYVWPEAQEAFLKVFRGKHLSKSLVQYEPDWTCYLKAEKPIFKFVRGNALLPWICEQFELKHKPILLLRHPLAVVSSQMFHGAWTNKKKERVSRSGNGSEYGRQLNASLEAQHREYINGLRTKEEKLMATWCVHNKVPLTSSKSQNWIVVCYESLLLDTKSTMSRVLSEWKIDFPEEMEGRFRLASRTTRDGSSQQPEEQLSLWKSRMDKAMQIKLLRVMDHFEIDIYGESIYPKSDF